MKSKKSNPQYSRSANKTDTPAVDYKRKVEDINRELDAAIKTLTDFNDYLMQSLERVEIAKTRLGVYDRIN